MAIPPTVQVSVPVVKSLAQIGDITFINCSFYENSGGALIEVTGVNLNVTNLMAHCNELTGQPIDVQGSSGTASLGISQSCFVDNRYNLGTVLLSESNTVTAFDKNFESCSLPNNFNGTDIHCLGIYRQSGTFGSCFVFKETSCPLGDLGKETCPTMPPTMAPIDPPAYSSCARTIHWFAANAAIVLTALAL